MKKALMLLLCSFISCVGYATGTKIATQAWVLKMLQDYSILGGVSVRTNDDQTITFRSPFASSDDTNAVSIVLTFRMTKPKPKIVLRKKNAISLYSARPIDNFTSDTEEQVELMMALTGGEIIKSNGAHIPFDLGGELALQTYVILPLEPSSDHVCEYGEDCFCVDYDNTEENVEKNVELPSKYQIWDANKIYDEVGLWSDWIDTDLITENTDPIYFKTLTKQGETVLEYRLLCVDTDGLYSVKLDDVEKSPAWIQAIAQSVTTYVDPKLKICQEAYYLSHICDKKNEQPKHDWETSSCGQFIWKVCKRNPSHTEGSEAHDWSNMRWNSSSHTCSCGKKYEPHKYGAWAQESISPGAITSKRTCSVCGFDETKTEPCRHQWSAWVEEYKVGKITVYVRTCSVCHLQERRTDASPAALATCDAENDIHIPLPTTCGCVCGAYGPDGAISSNETFHKWDSQSVSNGIQNCMCLCGHYHKLREITTYLKNLRKACPRICVFCNKKSHSGIGVLDAHESEHTPCEVVDGRCGCLCGTVAVGTDNTEYHVRRPGTCHCFGSKGQTTPGRFHYRSPRSDCERICSYCGSLCANHKVEEGTIESKPKDHTRKENGCGCKCGRYDGTNRPEWSNASLHTLLPNQCGCYCGFGQEDFSEDVWHRKAREIDCDCECGMMCKGHVRPTPPACRCTGKCHNPQHFVVTTLKGCTNVCHGVCGESKDSARQSLHTPKPTGSARCGCECEEIPSKNLTLAKFHENRDPSLSCWCVDHKIHHPSPRELCPLICSICEEVSVDSSHTRAPGRDDHDFSSPSCVCACGEWHKHQFADNSCRCYCGSLSRSHLYVISSEDITTQDPCQSCHNTIYHHIRTYTCSRCGESYIETFYTGHDPNCGLIDTEQPSLMHLCEVHRIWFSDYCPQCQKESYSDGESSGSGASETSGKGGLDDI